MKSEEISLKSLIAPHFHETYRDMKRGDHSVYWLSGGRGSTKSSLVALRIITDMMKDSEANAIATRKVGNTIRDSLLSTCLWAIDALQVNAFWKASVAPAGLKYLPTGQAIYLRGLDDEQKLKSFKIRKGYAKHLWFEEASELDGPEQMRSVSQSIMRGSEHKFFSYITYNPPKDPRSWVNEYKKQMKNDPSILFHHSTYLDVPREWLGSRFIHDAERLQINNLEAYKHEYLGEAIGDVKRLVFWGRYEVQDFDFPGFGQIYQGRVFPGLDFGFSQDPLAAMVCFLKDDCLFIWKEGGGVGIENEEIPKVLDSLSDPKCNFNIRDWQIKADCARPDTISYICRQGFNCVGAEKGKGSVEDGIAYMKAFKKIIIHSSCVRTIKEFENYSYKVDKNSIDELGNPLVLPVLQSGWDHWIDATRYSIDDYIRQQVSILDIPA